MEQASFRDWFGEEPEEIARRLHEFTRTCEFLSKETGLVDRYPEKWIGAYDRKIQATADDLDSLLEELDRMGVPRRETVIRYIEKNPRMLILHNAAR